MSYARVPLVEVLSLQFENAPESKASKLKQISDLLDAGNFTRLFDAINGWEHNELIFSKFVVELQLIIENTRKAGSIQQDELRTWMKNLILHGRSDIILFTGKKLKPELVEILELNSSLKTISSQKKVDEESMLHLIFYAYVSSLSQRVLHKFEFYKDMEEYVDAYTRVGAELAAKLSKLCKSELAFLRRLDNAKMISTGVLVGAALVAAGVGALFSAKKVEPPVCEFELANFPALLHKSQ